MIALLAAGLLGVGRPVGIILIILVILMICGIPGVPYGYNRAGTYGHQPSGLLGILLLVLLILLLMRIL